MIIYYLLVSTGLHWILKYGTILNVPRQLVCRVPLVGRLFKCSLCLGFWSGIIIATVCDLSPYTDSDIYAFPFASAGVCWLLDNFNNILQSIEIKLDQEEK